MIKRLILITRKQVNSMLR